VFFLTLVLESNYSMLPCGFNNLGNTCYLNCAIQSLLSLHQFRYFLHAFSFSNDSCVSLLKTCSTNTNKSIIYSLEVLYTLYKTLFPCVLQNSQEDALECMLRFIECFEKRAPHTARVVKTGCLCDSMFQSSHSYLRTIFTGVHERKHIYKCCGKITTVLETFTILVLNNCTSIKNCLNKTLYNNEIIKNTACDFCHFRTSEIEQYIVFHRIPPVLIFDVIDNRSLQIENTFVIEHTHGTMTTVYTYILRSIMLYNKCHYSCIVFRRGVFYLTDDQNVHEIEDYTMYQHLARCVIYEREF